MDMSNKTSDKNVEIVKELIQEYKTYGDLDGIQDLNIYVNSLEELLAEREQNKKRIKELEEENAMLKKADNIARDVNIEEVTEVMNKSYEEFMSNYINKQKVIDLMEKETIDISGFECVAVEDIQELLEGEK